MINHASARVFCVEGFVKQMGRPPTRPEAQLQQSVGFLETGYAQTWKPPGSGSCNWGAIQGTGPAGFFSYTDTTPQADGTSKPYAAKFCKYSSMPDGAAALAHEVYQSHKRDSLVLPAATRGDALAFSTGLHTSGYYEGYGATVDQRIAHHVAAVLNACRLMALELGEPMPDGSAPIPLPAAALRQGMVSDAVKAWQRVLVLNGFDCIADGSFGPKTRILTMLLQKKLGLTVDGVVGAVTQAAAVASYQGRQTDPAPPSTEDNS